MAFVIMVFVIVAVSLSHAQTSAVHAGDVIYVDDDANPTLKSIALSQYAMDALLNELLDDEALSDIQSREFTDEEVLHDETHGRDI